MRTDRAILIWLLFGYACATTLALPDPTERALRDAGMLDVLEARLLASLEGISDGTERSETIGRLADVYRGMMDSLEPGSPERDAVVQRAWALADRASMDEAMELRLALLIDSYLPLERAVGLHEIGLLSPEEHTRRAIDLSLVHRKLRAIAGSAVPDAVRDERLARTSEDPEVQRRARESARLRSLSSYYAAWSGLMLSILEDRQPGNDVLPAFGWLLGGEGAQPRLDDIRDSSFGLEHVARAAMGVARAKHRAGDTVLAMMWLDKVIESSAVSDTVREQALLRRLRFLAQEQAWPELLRELYQTLGTGSDRSPLPPGEARFHAIRALDAIRGGAPGDDPESVAALALGDLVRRGEIGHVLDLRKIYGSLPALEDGFVGRYADALDRLEASEASGSPVRYLDAAGAFERAARSDDADRFERQRDDAELKRLYCLIRGARPSEAIDAAEDLLGREDPLDDTGEEEARWLLIIAIESASDPRREDQLRVAIRSFLAQYRGTDRARMLLVRYAGTPMLEPGEGIDGLRVVEDSDPIALDARRVLIRLLYKDWIASARVDESIREEIAASIGWVWAQPASEPDSRAAFDVARIAVDIGLGAEPRMMDLAAAGLRRASDAIGQEASLARFEPEIRVLRIEWLALSGRLQAADDEGEPLRQAADTRAERADRIVLSVALREVEQRPDLEVDRLIVRVGMRVVDAVVPPAPAELDTNISGLVASVIRSAMRLGDSEVSSGRISLRLGRVLLERGSPSAQIVRELAAFGGEGRDPEVEWLAWSTLLSASNPEEPVWWEARYHTLRMLLARDAETASAAYAQHRALYPIEGPAPWGALIRELFADESAVQPGDPGGGSDD